MKNTHRIWSLPILAAGMFTLISCDVKVDKSDPPNNTTVVTPGKEDKKVENNTTIVNPAKEKTVEKKETNTTIVNPPKP